jgi:uncharacterized protein YwgA
MKDYWLAKLISSVEEVDSRKRLQKSIYLLQLAGCPLQCDYLLHYYGPYSFELAGLIDQLDGADIIEEKPEPTAYGERYKSVITRKGKDVLASFERTKAGVKARKVLRSFVPRFQGLNKENGWVLELAATIAYFHEDNWTKARIQAAKFKRVRSDDSNLRKALELAKGFKLTA